MAIFVTVAATTVQPVEMPLILDLRDFPLMTSHMTLPPPPPTLSSCGILISMFEDTNNATLLQVLTNCKRDFGAIFML